VVSGRDLADLKRRVGIDGIVYAGSHGFDIRGPAGLRMEHAAGADITTAVMAAAERLKPALAGVAGALVEVKRFAVAVHYRQVRENGVAAVEEAVDRVAAGEPLLHKTHGKKLFELRPRLEWDKGKAVLWLLDAFAKAGAPLLPFFIGDDITDEDAFRAVAGRGVTIVVGTPERTAAAYTLADPDEVGRFLTQLTGALVVPA
jgi:alpha,alpha-trehalase